MNLDVAAVLADAWRMWKRDRDLLLGAGGFFLFLPQFMVLQLVRDPPVMPKPDASAEAVRIWTEAATQWASHYGLIWLGCGLWELFGTLLIYVLYLYKGRLDLKAALPAALWLLPRYLLVSVLSTLPIVLVHASAIWMLLFFPIFYVTGRMLLAAAAMVAEQPIGAVGSLKRGFEISRGHGLLLAGAAIPLLFGPLLLAAPFILLGRTFDGAPLANPVSAVLLDSMAAGAAAFASLAAVLIQVALYRRLVANEGI